MSAPKVAPLKVGVLICAGGVQLLDLAAVDLLAMLTPSYLLSCGFPENIVEMGREITFHYIADAVKGNGDVPTYAPLTGDASVRITDTLDSVGSLDFLFVPGPNPTYVPSPETITFVQKHASSVRALLVVCSGILPIAFSGILAGKRATAPLGLLPMMREKMPDVQWVAKRWTVDEEGKIWTSGGVTNGIDMMAAFVKEFAPELAKVVCGIADVGERGQEYPEWQMKTKLF